MTQTVLIVDDEPFITSIMKRKLEERGLNVVVASDGEEALEAATRIVPALVVTDLQMPHISGLELAVALRKLPATSTIPLIMLTGRGHYVAPDILQRTNIRKLVSKPFSAREVVDAVQELLSARTSEAA